MTDVAAGDGGAPAPAEEVSGAVIEEAPSYSQPLPAQVPPTVEKREEKQPEPAKTVREAVQRGMEKAKAQAAEKAKAEQVKDPVKDQPKEPAKDRAEVRAETKEPAPRAPDGKFTAREPQQQDQQQAPKQSAFREAPSRFDDAAKTEWERTPESVRGAIHRAVRELEQGHQKYKAAAERDASLNEFHEMAARAGKDLPSVVRDYVAMENHLRNDLIGGLDLICSRMGVSIRDVAAHIMGQTPEQITQAHEATIRELRNELAELKNQLGGVKQTFEQQQLSLIERDVMAFKAEHPRFDELAEDIAFFLKTRCPGDLKQAYELAERLNPAPAEAEQPLIPATKEADHTRAETKPLKPEGQKSIAGSPATGASAPEGKAGPVPSTREAIRRAMSRVKAA